MAGATPNHVWYCHAGNQSTTGHYAVAKWAASTAYTIGQLVRQFTAPAVNSERVFVATVAGTSSSTEPTWVVTKGAKNTDGTVTWQECTGQAVTNGDVANTPLSSANRSAVQALGTIIQNNIGSYLFICTTSGTSAAGEPSYNLTAGVTTSDNTCTWTCLGVVGMFAAWAAPFARIASAGTATWGAVGDTFYVASTHAETQASAVSFSVGNSTGICTMACVSNTSYTPPLASDYTTGASVVTTGANAISISGCVDIWGMSFSCGTGANNSIMQIGTSGNSMRLHNCRLTNTQTGTSACISIGNGSLSNMAKIELINVTMNICNASTVAFSGGNIIWRDTPSGAVSSTPSWGLSWISATTAGATTILVEGVDFSNVAVTGASFWTVGSPAQKVVLSGCKLPITAVGSTSMSGYAAIDVINCDSGNAVSRHEHWTVEGAQTMDVVAVRTNGASDGSTAIAWRITSPNGSNTIAWGDPFESMPIAIWWTSTLGPTGTISLQCLYNGTTLPFNDGIWLETRYYGSTTSPLLTFNTTGKTYPLSTHTQYSASTAAWDSIAVTRVNTSAYVVGNLFRLSSNPGQLFICVTAGTTASSQPGAYTSVADGVSVTDGSSVFRALVRFSMSMTLSPIPQQSGNLRCYIRTSLFNTTFWVDPLITLS